MSTRQRPTRKSSSILPVSLSNLCPGASGRWGNDPQKWQRSSMPLAAALLMALPSLAHAQDTQGPAIQPAASAAATASASAPTDQVASPVGGSSQAPSREPKLFWNDAPADPADVTQLRLARMPRKRAPLPCLIAGPAAARCRKRVTTVMSGSSSALPYPLWCARPCRCATSAATWRDCQ